MDQQKKEINLIKEEIREMIDNLESGTMITMEIPVKETEENNSGYTRNEIL